MSNELPTVLRIGPYRFFFFASDQNEPIHIHIERDDRIAKFWLDPIRLQSSGGFSRNEMARIQSIISEHQIQLKEAWHAYFHD
ncbi:DUF4160 domain-containing protein [Nitrosomonas sp.]|uniref:DUF4160 domain-containing protein n=1 Tax=Nitrosomonas sp. TaxID=42353 RepID=UPI003521E281